MRLSERVSQRCSACDQDEEDCRFASDTSDNWHRQNHALRSLLSRDSVSNPRKTSRFSTGRTAQLMCEDGGLILFVARYLFGLYLSLLLLTFSEITSHPSPHFETENLVQILSLVSPSSLPMYSSSTPTRRPSLLAWVTSGWREPVQPSP